MVVYPNNSYFIIIIIIIYMRLILPIATAQHVAIIYWCGSVFLLGEEEREKIE